MTTKNGFRDAAAGSKKEQLKQLQIEVKNMQMAQRISQMMHQQLINKLTALDQDMNRAMNLLNDLQYRTLATIELEAIDREELDTIADGMKLKDYNQASDNEDVQKNYSVADVVVADSICIITSEAADDKGIFRSKFKLSDSGLPDLQAALLGKKVGERALVKIGEIEHDIEVVGIRTAPPAPITPEVVPATAPELKAVDVTVTQDQVADAAEAATSEQDATVH